MSILESFQKKQKTKIQSREFWLSIGPFIASMVLVVLVIIALFAYHSAVARRGEVLGAATSAYENLMSAYGSLNSTEVDKADNFFKEAGQDFKDIEDTLIGLSELLRPFNSDTVESALHLTRAGRAIASAGVYLGQGVVAFTDITPAFENAVVLDSSRGLSGNKMVSEPGQSANILEHLKRSKTDFQWAINLIGTAAAELEAVKLEALPSSMRPQIAEARLQIQKVYAALDTLSKYNDLLTSLTEGTSKSYLLLFQNTAETRPTGGFIGTYGLLKVRNGKIDSLLIESVYEIDGRLTRHVEPPQPLEEITMGKWAMRDSNWWPDFKASAEQISQFYEWQGGQTVDGVIAFTPEIARNILMLTGPVSLPEHGVVIDAENYYDVIQFKTSKDYDLAENKPKKLIADLAGKIFSEITEMPNDRKIRLMGVLVDSIHSKDVQVFHRDEGIQAQVRKLGMSGELLDLSQHNKTDYLLITNANVGGGKTDRFVRQNVHLSTSLSRGGQVTNNLTLWRKNLAPKDVEYPLNKDYVRIYVPKGSRLLSSSGNIDVYEELDRTVFATRIDLLPEQETELNIKYQIPSSRISRKTYTLVLEKNAGQRIDSFALELKAPPGTKIVYNTAGQNQKNNTLSISEQGITSNRFWGVVYE